MEWPNYRHCSIKISELTERNQKSFCKIKVDAKIDAKVDFTLKSKKS